MMLLYKFVYHLAIFGFLFFLFNITFPRFFLQDRFTLHVQIFKVKEKQFSQ